MNFFCTFFDSRYMRQGLALHRSLLAQASPFHLWILCMDDQAHSFLKRADLLHVSLLTLNDIAVKDADILMAKGNRSTVELYFSSKSFLCRYLFATQPQIDLLTYLDADMYFFSSPNWIMQEMKGYSVGLTPHRFPQHLKKREQYGLYNAGFISIRRDESGLACLDWWRKSCLDWCHDYVSEGRFADQGYLSMIPARFPKVRIINNKGINAAPWNISQFRVEASAAGIKVDDDHLVLYHFHGVKRIGSCLYDAGFSGYQNFMSRIVRGSIYWPYIADIVHHQVPETAIDGAKDIRIAPGRRSRFRSFMPGLWNTLNVIRILARGIRYRSLICTWKRTMTEAA